MIRLLALILAASLLGACSSAPRIAADLRPQLWLEHQLKINTITSWDINGRLAVKNEKDSGTATLLWNQTFANYELRVIAPLGQGTYILKGTRDGVIMQGPDNKFTMARTAEQLLHEQLGWKLHLNGLKYWIRGMPEPYISFSALLLDEQGRLTHIKQSGFDVSISRYTDHEGFSLPEKLVVESDDIRVKLVIQAWKI